PGCARTWARGRPGTCAGTPPETAVARNGPSSPRCSTTPARADVGQVAGRIAQRRLRSPGLIAARFLPGIATPSLALPRPRGAPPPGTIAAAVADWRQVTSQGGDDECKCLGAGCSPRCRAVPGNRVDP